MPEKRWVNWLKADRNMLGIDYSKYNQKKIPIVYWFVLLVFCKKSKYRKK